MTIIFWLIFLICKTIIGGFSFLSLLDSIATNILGLIPPIIIFNFIYEYISKEYVASEISERLLETLTGNSNMMDTFKENIRRDFIKSTIKSLVNDNEIDMVYDVLQPYINGKSHDMRLDYKYHIGLEKIGEENDAWSSFFSSSNYYNVREAIEFNKVLSAQNTNNERFSVGFFVDAKILAKELLEKNYLFRENLKVLNEDFEKLIILSNDEKINFVKDSLCLQFFINGNEIDIEKVSIENYGIIVDFIPQPTPIKVFHTKIAFRMPQIKARSEFLISLPEPTLNPLILFTYNTDYWEITAYQFLNDDKELNKSAGAIPGRYEFNPNGWIHPVKGVIFIISYIDDENVISIDNSETFC